LNLPKEGFKVLTVREEVEARAKNVYHKLKLRDKSFSKFVGDLLLKQIEWEEATLKVTMPMREIGRQESSFLIRDAKLGKVVEVTRRADNLFCHEDKRVDCIHVGFAYAHSATYQLQKR
jgi:hypothetical protein